MKIYCAHSRNFDFKKDFYRPLETFGGHEFVFPHQDDQSIDSKEIIKSCDLVIAEVSYPSTGMGIEIGWANVIGIPIIAVHQKVLSPSSSMNVVAKVVFSYENADDLIQKLRPYLDH